MFSIVAEILDGERNEKKKKKTDEKSKVFKSIGFQNIHLIEYNGSSQMCTADVDTKNAETGLLPQTLVLGNSKLMIHLC